VKTNIRRNLYLYSLIILIGIGGLGYAVYKSNQKIVDSEYWVQHTELVILGSAKIFSTVKDIETTSRGFVITNDSSFLKPMHIAQKTVFVYVRQLRQLTSDNPSQQELIDSLSLYIKKRLDFSLRMVELRSNSGLAPAIAYTSGEQGKHYMEHIGQKIKAIEQEEGSLLKQQKKINERSILIFDIASKTIFVLMSGFTILLIILTEKYLFQNKEKEKRAKELVIANGELLFQNGEKEKRAAELIMANKELLFQNEEKEKRALELMTANIERTKMASEMMLRNTELEQFAYIVSHNLRSPLANIIGASNALNDLDLSVGDKEILTKGINVSVIKLDNVIKDLNHILEIKGHINEIKEIVHLSELADEVKSDFKNLIEKLDIEINYDFSEINQFLTLKVYMYSIFYNLISNSIKYRCDTIPCIILIKSRVLKNLLELTFTDNGRGIDLKKNGDKVFGLYRRFHPGTEGKGVGLFMVKTQVEALGGKISVQSIENEGTTFKIEFEI